MRPARAHLAALFLCGVGLVGCQPLGSLFLLFGPRRIQKAEYKLTPDRLAVFVETARRDEDNPIFTRALHEKLVEIFRERKVKTHVVPLEEIYRLRQENADFARWSVPRIGRAVSAQQVLYIRVDRLQLRDAPDSPLLSPAAKCHLKVFAVDEHSEDPLLWPPATERDGREFSCERHSQEAADASIIDSEAAKLGKDLAQWIAQPFYDVDLEETTPKEP